jgi:hypothetical protein
VIAAKHGYSQRVVGVIGNENGVKSIPQRQQPDS